MTFFRTLYALGLSLAISSIYLKSMTKHECLLQARVQGMEALTKGLLPSKEHPREKILGPDIFLNRCSGVETSLRKSKRNEKYQFDLKQGQYKQTLTFTEKL